MKLEIMGVKFSYNCVPVLKEINFTLEKGELLGIIGPNGTGKSTLLRCINRLLEPQGGSIFIDGEDLLGLGARELAKKISRVPQHENQNFPITVFDAVLMGRKPHGGWKPGREDLEITSEVISILGLEHLSLRDISEISGGERQKVMIARAIVQDTDILLLDEPTSNLDLKHQLEVLNIVRDQLNNEMSVIMAIHDLNLAARYADKLIMLNEGVISAAGSQDIITEENIESVYGVKASIIEYSGNKLVIPESPLS